MTFQQFQKRAQKYNVITLQKELVVDAETPVSIFQRFRDEPYSFLFESVEGGERWARYTFMGFQALELFRSSGKRFEWKKQGKNWNRTRAKDPLRELEKRIRHYRHAPVPGDLPLTAGAIGYFGYDTVRFIERLPIRGKTRVDTWDFYLMVPQILLIFDNREQLLRVLYQVPVGQTRNLRRRYDDAVQALKEVCQKIQEPQGKAGRGKRPRQPSRRFRTLWNQRSYEAGVRKIQEYIRAGDCIQTVLSMRLQAPFHADPFDIYRALRHLNPSPYMFYLHLKDHQVVGASPETMVRLEGKELIIRPIAGTRPRGKTKLADRALEKELLADPKERAEHIMLVDLARNDLGRIARKNSVEVDELMRVERYSHVMHIVSNVRAQLAAGQTAFDVLRASFPAGTLSGAPKVRAMQIIDELEPIQRGIYGGCVGYIDFLGNLDTAITIRTAIVRGNVVSVQAGAGIVTDSKPRQEFQECINKAKGVLRAVEMAEKGL